MLGTLKLNVIGAGRAGRTLARVFATTGAATLGEVFDASADAAAAARQFIGSGRAVASLAQMSRAEAWMLTTSDDQIAAAGKTLAASGLLSAGDVVFHCSGATPSRDLKEVLPASTPVASVHPLRSFADPEAAARTFSGTYCAAEGDESALRVLEPLFAAAGARVSRIDPEFKTIYHAASVIVCNYLTALMESGLRSYAKAGLERDHALRMIEPLVRETLDNVFRLGTVNALTGPIARGDAAVVERQVEALAGWNASVAAVYRDLGMFAAELAQAQGKADRGALAKIVKVLESGR